MFKKEVDNLYIIVKKLHPNLTDLEKDKKEIDEQLGKGEEMMHHSEHYLLTYQRRYRIIHRSVFEQWKNTYIKRN